MKHFLVALLVVVVLLAFMMMGVFAAMGICATIWGAETFDAVWGNPPMRAHPAYLTATLLGLPLLMMGAATGVICVILPIFARFGIPCRGQGLFPTFVRSYAKLLQKVTPDTDVTPPSPEQGAHKK